MTDLEKAGSGSVRDIIFNAVVDAVKALQQSGPGGSVTVGDIDSQASSDGDVITSDGDGTASWAPGGGSQPGTLQVAEVTFAQVSGGGSTYTGTFDLPADSTLVGIGLTMLTDWEDPAADLEWDGGDESSPTAFFDAEQLGFGTDGTAFKRWDATNAAWSSSGTWHFDGVPYPSGQTLTISVTDVTGGTGTALARFWYYTAPDTSAAVVS